jgi:hypothetical protein
MKRLVAILATIAILVGACSGSGKATTITALEPAEVDTPTAAPQPSDTAEQTAPEPEATAVPTPAATPERPPAELQNIIITLDDMPTGWSPSPPDEDEEDDSSDCIGRAFDTAGIDFETTSSSTEASFSQSDFGPFFVVVVARPDGNLRQAFGVFAEVFEGCNGEVDADGNIYTYSPLSFPSHGDETFAIRMNIEGFFPVTSNVTFTRVGDTLILALALALGGGNDAEMQSALVELMAARAR